MFYDGTIYEELAHNIIKDWTFWTSAIVCSLWFFVLMKTIVLSRIKYNKDGERVIRVYKSAAVFLLAITCGFWYIFNLSVVYTYFAMNGKNGAGYFEFICLILQCSVILFICFMLIVMAFNYIVYITNKRAGRFNFWPFKQPKEIVTNTIIGRFMFWVLRPKEILFKDAECEEGRSLIIKVIVQICEKSNKDNAVDITVPIWKVKKIEELIGKEQESV